MASDIESSGEKIVSYIGIHHVRKIFCSSGRDYDITPSAQDLTQGILGSKATKNVPGADEQNAVHIRATKLNIGDFWVR
jgi:hypothetical protein